MPGPAQGACNAQYRDSSCGAHTGGAGRQQARLGCNATQTPGLGRLGALRARTRLVRLDGAVRGGVRHAGQHEALLHLVIVQEGLVGLVDLATLWCRRASEPAVSAGPGDAARRAPGREQARGLRAGCLAAAARGSGSRWHAICSRKPGVFTSTLPAQDEHAPARQEYGRSMPASCERAAPAAVAARQRAACGRLPKRAQTAQSEVG
jgi:hypothetical protein